MRRPRHAVLGREAQPHVLADGADPPARDELARGDLLIVVGGVVYLRLALLRFPLLLALLLRRVLRTLRGFLTAIGLTVHVSACLSSRKAGRDEQCPHLYRYGHCLGVSQGDGFISCPSYQRVREKGIGKMVRFSG